MKCNNCNCNIEGDAFVCPLCHEKLPHHEQAPVYPKLSVVKRKPFFISSVARFYFFITLITFFILLISNIVTLKKYPSWWSIFVGLVFSYGLILIKNTIPQNFSLSLKMVVQILFFSFLMLSLKLIFKIENNVFGYALPITLLTAIIVFFILTMCLQRKDNTLIFSFVVFSIIVGLIPMIFWLAGFYQHFLFSIICFSVSASLSLFTVIFFSKSFIEGFKKKYHI